MIGEDRVNGRRKYTCDGKKDNGEDCGAVAHFKNYDEARKEGGWSVSYWRDKCYCPECAPKYKNVGCTGKKPASPGTQLKIAE